MIYELDRTAQEHRYFSKKLRYSEIDWSDLDQIIGAYRQRIQDWYLEPAKELAKNVHFAFSVMALNCLLIDTLSQFVAGLYSSTSKEFKEFIRKRLPSIYSCKLKVPIQHDDGKAKRILQDVAEVLYHGFRCGILHQAHILPYSGVAPSAEHAVREVSAFVKYKGSGANCPTIIVDPVALVEDLDEAFENYLDALRDRDPKNDQLRANFKKKFSVSFGIDVSAAA